MNIKAWRHVGVETLDTKLNLKMNIGGPLNREVRLAKLCDTDSGLCAHLISIKSLDAGLNPTYEIRFLPVM